MAAISSEDLLEHAMKLPDDKRAKLASELLASLDGPADADVEQAWGAEIKRRIADVESGSVELEDWQQVRKRIGARFEK
jgi:putative addiction module component (TIGR02574 family)